MDKTTLNQTPADQDWMLRAIGQLLSLRIDGLVGLSRGRPLSKLRRDPEQGRYRSGMHDHAVPELCLLLSGEPFIDIGSQRFIMRAPALAILPSRVNHCEGWTHPRRPYELSWISPSRVSLHILRVIYHPTTDWTITHGYTLNSPIAQMMMQRLDHPDHLASADGLEPLRADLLTLFAQLYRDLITRPPSHVDQVPGRSIHPALEQVRHLLDHHFQEPWTLEQLANLVRLTPNYLNRLFRRWTGRSIHQSLTDRRMAEAVNLLRQRKWLIKEIARRVGYDDPLYFSRVFHRHHGHWPTQL